MTTTELAELLKQTLLQVTYLGAIRLGELCRLDVYLRRQLAGRGKDHSNRSVTYDRQSAAMHTVT